LRDAEKRKLEEIRRRAEEEEARRIEKEVAKRAEELMRLRRQRGKKKDQEAEQETEEKRKRAEEVRQALEEEKRRLREADERNRREEERRRKEEESRRRVEGEARSRAEEDKRRREEAERYRRQEETRRKKEEEEAHQKEREARERVRQSLRKAQEFLAQGAFDSALAEVEKVLAPDPMHVEALQLDQRIRSAKAETDAVRAERIKEVEQVREERKAAFPEPVIEKRPWKPLKLKARRPISKNTIIGGIAAILVIVAGVVLVRMSGSLFEEKRSVAILPFASQANTDDERILGMALAEETTILLAHFPGVRVMGASSAVNLLRFTPNARVRANKLNYTHTVSGTISAAGNSVILNVDIVDTLGKTVWKGRLEKPRDNLMELSTALASAVAQAFILSLSNKENDLLSRRPTTNGEAYVLYLRGREMLHQRTHTAAQTAIELFRQATSKDPNFAEAYGAAAYSFLHIYEAGWSDDPAVLSRAVQWAEKANSLRGHIAEAHTVLGGVYQITKKYEGALYELDEALTTMPSNAEARRITGIIYTIGGEQGRAMEHLRSAYELDPVNPDVLTSVALGHERFGKPKEAMAYFNQALRFISDTTTYLAEIAGNALVSSYQYERAIKLYEQRIALNPRSFIDEYKLARAYQLAGRPKEIWSAAFEKTITKLEDQLQRDPQNVLAFAYLGLAYSRYGRFPEGEANGKRALRMAPNNLTAKYKLADMYSVQKKKPEAIAALKEALSSRYILAEIVDLDMYNVSDEPGFQQTIVEELP